MKRIASGSIVTAALGLAFTGCHGKASETNEADSSKLVTQALPAQPSLNVSVTPLGSGMVAFTVTTNLPTPLAAMASLDLQGVYPHESAIGTSRQVTLDKPTTMFSLKALNDDEKDGKVLPDGRYDAEVIVGPKWKENLSIASLPGNLEAKQVIDLKTGRSASAVSQRSNLQRWVMNNVDANSPWNEAAFVARLGHYVKTPSGASQLADALYFPNADMTFIVNRPAKRLVIWRIGRATR